MNILQVKQYNNIQQQRWSEAMDKHEYHTQADFYTCPQLAFYCFFTNAGVYRLSGYVAFDHDRHVAIWRPTKHEAIEYFTKHYDN